jgi:hypothetical protein
MNMLPVIVRLAATSIAPPLPAVPVADECAMVLSARIVRPLIVLTLRHQSPRVLELVIVQFVTAVKRPTLVTAPPFPFSDTLANAHSVIVMVPQFYPNFAHRHGLIWLSS